MHLHCDVIKTCHRWKIAVFAKHVWHQQCSQKTFMVHQIIVRWVLYSIQICEISHRTFGSSHRKCQTFPTISVVNTVRVWENKFSGILLRKTMFLMCSKQNSIRPGQFPTRPAQNLLALVRGQVLASLSGQQSETVWCLTHFYLRFENWCPTILIFSIGQTYFANTEIDK